MAMHFSEEDQKKLREDTSEIYKKRTEESTKSDVKNMDAKGKLRYFFDYYFKFVVVGAVVLAVLLVLFKEIFKKKPAEALYVVISQEVMENEKLQEFSEALEDYFKIDKQREEIVVEICPSDLKLQTYIFANTADVLIMDEDNFSRWGTADYFFTAEENKEVSFYQDYEEKYRYLARHLTAEDRAKQEEDKTAEPEDKKWYHCGLYLADSKKCQQISLAMKQPVIAILKGTKHKKNAVKFVKYMMDNEIPLTLTGD